MPTRLGPVQEQILLWLIDQEENLRNTRQEEKIRDLEENGLRWRPNDVLKDNNYSDRKNPSVSISKALKSLRSKGLVETIDTSEASGKKRRTSNVKLTKNGYLEAFQVPPTANRRVANLTLKATIGRISQKKNEALALMEKIGKLVSHFDQTERDLTSDSKPARLLDNKDLKHIAELAERALREDLTYTENELAQLEKVS